MEKGGDTGGLYFGLIGSQLMSKAFWWSQASKHAFMPMIMCEQSAQG